MTDKANRWQRFLCWWCGHDWQKNADRWGHRHCQRCDKWEMLFMDHGPGRMS